MNRIDIPKFYEPNQRYWTDGKQVFYVDTPIVNVDPETFELYIGWFAKDKSHCYLEGDVFKKANAETFKVLNWAFSKDKNNVYTNRGILKDADPNTFVVIGDCYNEEVYLHPCGFGKDNNHIFYYAYGGRTMILKDADLDTFTALTNYFGKDKDNVWWNGKKLKNANPETFKLIDNSYGSDGKNIYCGNELLKGADVATFEIIEGQNYGKDKNYVYNGSTPIDFSTPNWQYDAEQVSEFIKKNRNK